MKKIILSEISRRISAAKNIMVVSHKRPDGDAIGSVLGMGLALQRAGKNVQMVLADGFPSTFHHLPGAKDISRKVSGPYDLSISLDASDLMRIAGVLREDEIPDINIDHHISNVNFGRINYVEPESAATCQVLTEIFPQLGLSIDKEIAEVLLTGIISDTLGFRTSNTTQATFLLTASLIDKGANLTELYNKALNSRSFEAVKYWGAGLSRMERSDGLAWTSLTLQDRSDVSYPGNDDADLINLLSSLDDFEMVLIFVEQKDKKVKVSWRSKPGVNVSNLASQFGGGGHPAAAGAEISGSLDEVKTQVLEYSSNFLVENRKNYYQSNPTEINNSAGELLVEHGEKTSNG
ncbi:MAG: bifunctional oligoribonuclease/PAP phosphatase NrnA [Anaerolineaceae bacterium]